MDFDKIDNDLHEVLQMLGEWRSKGSVDVIERDMALERLRAVYSALRFGDAGAVADKRPEVPAEESAPVMEPRSASEVEINLDEVLEQPMPAGERLDVDVPVSDGDTDSVAQQETGGASSDTVADDDATVTAPDLRPEEDKESEGDPEEILTHSTAAEPAAQTEPNKDPEPVVQSEPETEISPSAEPVSEPQPDLQPVNEPVELSAPAETKPSTDTIPEEHPVEHSAAGHEHAGRRADRSRSLFGDDDAVLRRTPRRVVMMSLYDDEPDVTVDFEAKPASHAFTTSNIISSEPLHGADAVTISSESADGASPVAETAKPEVEGDETSAHETERSAADASAVGPVVDKQKSEPAEMPTKTSEDAHRPYSMPNIDVAASQPDGQPVIGEVINNNVKTVADTIAPVRNVASELARKEHVDDLAAAVGVNDRYLLIRDLFKGDSAAYETAIAKLNGFDNLDDCMIYIVEHYSWNPNSDGARLLMDLLERKYS